MAVLLDTHAWVWSFSDSTRLSATARSAIAAADTVYVSPISFFEISHKARIGKWPAVAPFTATLPKILQMQNGVVAPFTPEICLRAGLMSWPHRDPFDRLLTASAEVLGVALVSKDPALKSLSLIRCIW